MSPTRRWEIVIPQQGIVLNISGSPYNVIETAGVIAGFGPQKRLRVGKQHQTGFWFLNLQELPVNIVNSCTYENPDNPTEILESYPTWLCFASEEGVGGCTGDSGGPVMVVEEVDNKDTRLDNRREYPD